MVLPVKMDLPVLLDPLDFPDPPVPAEIRESLDLLVLLDPLVPAEPLYVVTVSEQMVGNPAFSDAHLTLLICSFSG